MPGRQGRGGYAGGLESAYGEHAPEGADEPAKSRARWAAQRCAGMVWLSKTGGYEEPYRAAGAIQPWGSKPAPKGICTDRTAGTGKGSGARRGEADEER